MIFQVNKKEVELKFNIGFISRLDELYYVESGGMKFGQGFEQATLGLFNQNIPTLANVIKAAANDGKFSDKVIEEALEDYAEANEGLDSLFEEVIAGLKGAKIVGAKVQKMEDSLKKAAQKLAN